MSTDDFVPTNDLERALKSAAVDPGARPAFYRLLVDSEVFLLTPPSAENPGERTFADGAPVTLVNWKGSRGEFIPFFSSLERVQETVKSSGQAYGYIRLDGRTTFTMLTQNTFPGVLNPGYSCGKEFFTEEMKAMADGSFFNGNQQRVKAQRQIMLGQPRDYPDRLVETLRQFFQRQPSVTAAYLAQMHDVASGDPPHLIVGIECPGSMQTVAPDAVIAAREVSDGQPVDFIEVGGKDGSLDEYFKKSTEPFYQRAAP